MPFQRNHLYLTLHWIPNDYPAEAGQTGVRFDNPTGVPTQALVDACKASVLTMWTSASSAIGGGYALRYLRLARIGTDGKYVPGSSSFDGIYPVSGTNGAGGTVDYPLQSACATTLTTDVPHGQASKGRMFLPPIGAVLGPADHLWTVNAVDSRSTTVAAMLSALNGVLGGPASIFSVGTVKSATPLVKPVTGLYTGRRPDVQRRRAKGVADVKGTPKLVTLPA